MKTIYLAGGCFWGTEHFFKKIPGVISTEVGFSNGQSSIVNPSYKMVKQGDTGFAETVKLDYDEAILELKTIIKLYFKTIDPTSLNHQGGDFGTQYRTGIYYTCNNDYIIAKDMLAEEQKKYSQPLAVELLPLKSFYTAEEYHQDYLDKNPDGYCHIPLSLMNYADELRKEYFSQKKETQKDFKITEF